MGNCYSIDHITQDHIHTDITCNIEEPQQKYRLVTVSNRLSILFYPITMEGRRGITNDFVTITLHFDLFSGALVYLAKSGFFYVYRSFSCYG